LDGQKPATESLGAPRRLGLAWILSLVLPGAGQLYCGAWIRGVATLAFFYGAIAVMFLADGDAGWVGLRIAIMLYAFAGVDAYATAVEHNAGIEPDAPDNPRVAAILNLTTNGFGYVYLGWKIGFVTFFLLAFVWRSVGSQLPALGEALAFAMAAHAYVGARDARREWSREPDRERFTSRVPPALPWIVAAIVLAGYLVLVLLAQMMIFRR
jgi:TM2 domain-containing membrane protein YozV